VIWLSGGPGCSSSNQRYISYLVIRSVHHLLRIYLKVTDRITNVTDISLRDGERTV